MYVFYLLISDTISEVGREECNVSEFEILLAVCVKALVKNVIYLLFTVLICGLEYAETSHLTILC